MLKQTDSGIQHLHGDGEGTQDLQRRRRLLVDRPQCEQKPEQLCAPPRTSRIATTPRLEWIRQGQGIADRMIAPMAKPLATRTLMVVISEASQIAFIVVIDASL
jgi:hypothetical protein